MNYRKANINDISQLVEMRIKYLTDDYGSLSKKQVESLKASLPQYYKQHLGKDIIIYVCSNNSTIVSTAFLLVVEKPANPNFITGKTGDVLNVYTEPQYRKQGIAGNLIKILLEDSKKMNLAYVELLATKMGKPLYEKLGFKIEKSEYTPMKYRLV